MSSGIVKLFLVLLSVTSVGASCYFLEQAIRSDRSFQITSSPDEDEGTPEGEEVAGGGHDGGGHEAKKEDGHGGGHDGGEGGESADHKPASLAVAPGTPIIVAMEQTFANVLDSQKRAHSLMLKLDVELFEDANRALVDQRDGVLKSTIIETVREQTYEDLNTLGGKVYFKEVLVSRINEALRKAIVRDIHFNMFYMQ